MGLFHQVKIIHVEEEGLTLQQRENVWKNCKAISETLFFFKVTNLYAASNGADSSPVSVDKVFMRI